jgi:uncharacterized RDD family membrane protein YckC
VTPWPVGPARPAGIVTRVLAAAIDLGVVLVAGAGVLLAVVAVQFAMSPLTFQWPRQIWTFWMPVSAVIAAAYLTVAWATTGRTCGAAVLGLRVRSAAGGRIGWVRAAVRAVLYLVFPVGLLWVAVSSRRRSVQDALVRSVVRYDWCDDAGLRGLPMGSLVVESPVTDGDSGLRRGEPARALDDDGRNPR